MFRAAAVPVAAAAVVVAVAATAAAGRRGLVGAAVGATVVVGFFGAGLLVARGTRHRSPPTVMGAALVTYTAKVALLGLFLVLFRGTEAFRRDWFGASVIVCAVVWLVAEARAVTRMRVPLDVTVPPPADRREPR
jgi:ATP synthase protein I